MAPPAAERVCDPQQPFAARQAALVSVLAEHVTGATSPPVPRCVYLLSLTGGGMIAYAGWDDTGMPAAFAWPTQPGRWRTVPVESQGLNGGDPIAGTARFAPGALPTLLLGTQHPGSGGFGQLVDARPTVGGTLRTAALTKLVDHAGYDFFGNDLVLLTYRAGIPAHAAWNCNACWPVNDQTLYRWDGQALTPIADRVFPEPCLTATLFLGAIRDGDDAQAARYVAHPKLVAKARQMLDIRPGRPLAWRTSDCWTAGGAGMPVGELERRNWDRIPPPFRTRPPRETFDLTLERGRDRAILHMERRPDNWLITRVVVPPPWIVKICHLRSKTLWQLVTIPG